MAKNIKEYVAQEVINYAKNRDQKMKQFTEKIRSSLRKRDLNFTLCSTCCHIDYICVHRIRKCAECNKECCNHNKEDGGCGGKLCSYCFKMSCETCWQKWKCKEGISCDSCCYCK
jgi:hypothetical protein